MTDNQREHLRSIRSFPSLVKYLHEELDWPIRKNDFEDYTFEYTPEELGIDVKNAAKIQEIKRLRPFSANQPWGIFFVKFEPKQLPVVALRRILNQVVLKRRASTNSVDRTAWEMDDLLFVSNYGEGEERRISFAHFKQENEGNLPSLKVLGWDNLDTPLHLDHIATELREKLHWPSDVDNTEQWREAWRSAFTISHREVVTSSIILAIRLAELARAIRDRARSILKIETQDGPVTKLMAAFKESLIHDLNEDDFSDMYAQTIAYGLLSARIANPTGDTSDNFSEHMSGMNPFLKELMETFLHPVAGKTKKAKTEIDFDELGVSDVIELLDNTNIEAVVRDFGDRNPLEDPVIHFYELFLKEYDAEKRMQRGVFYTPRPVVSFIVRSVDELLQTEFGLEDGLADTTTWGEMAERIDDLKIPVGATPDQVFVQILDPATGTGTFLVEVIDLIHTTMREKWEREYGPLLADVNKRWNEYVPKYLLPRLFGYELLMAPYAIAHMKIGLKLVETGYSFGNNERVQIYLTNSLEPALDFSGVLDFAVPALANEAAIVTAIKRERRFTVIIGNPPYSISSSNKGMWIKGLLAPYKEGLGERNVNTLSDDYVKFIRLAEHIISKSGYGTVGMITNNSFLDGVTHRLMRDSLLSTYKNVFCIDLHGSVNVIERYQCEEVDDNVFDIQQGVSISLLVANPCSISQALFHYDSFGNRHTKYEFLSENSVSSVKFTQLAPGLPYHFFKPKDFSHEKEYMNGWSMKDIFGKYSTGIKFRKDNLLVKNHFTKRSVMEMLADIQQLSPCELFAKYNFNETLDWKLDEKRKYFNTEQNDNINRVAYRPFNERYTYYPLDDVNKIIVRGDSRVNLMKHMLLTNNISIVTTRLNRQVSTNYFFVTRDISDLHLLDNARDSMQVFPLFTYNERLEFESNSNKQSNLTEPFLNAISNVLSDHQNSTTGEFISSENILNYAYGVFYSPSYQNRYSEFLKIDFPRLPLAGSAQLFLELSKLGGDLVALHLMESPEQDNNILTIIGSGVLRVEKVSYSEETVWIDRAKTLGFKGVSPAVWNFHIGGYQVCHKWLKDRQAKGGKNPRPGLILSDGDIEHYRKIVVALYETIRIMKEIDEVIEKYGGWPDAFRQTE